MREITLALTRQNDCPDKTIAEVVKKYEPEILAPQIEVLMNNELRDIGVTKLLVRRSGLNYVSALQVSDSSLTPQVLAYNSEKYIPALGSVYCGGEPAFELARAIDAKLTYDHVKAHQEPILPLFAIGLGHPDPTMQGSSH